MSLLDRYSPNGIFRLWEYQPKFLLCADSGRRAKKNGTCPKHGGDACLFFYVQVSALTRALEAAVADAKKDSYG